jgi:hypothetical protein
MPILTIQKKTLKKSFGVNIAGYINSEKGVGEAVRSSIRSLSAVNIPYTKKVQRDLDVS